MQESSQPPRVPRPKNGLFDSLANAQTYYQQNKEKYPIEKFISMTLENANQKEGQRGALLLMADPNVPVSRVFALLNKKLFPLEKPGKKDMRGNQAIFYFYKQSKKMASPIDQESVRVRYEQFKDEHGLLPLVYQDPEDRQFILTGWEKAALFLIIPLAVPVIATVYAFDWTTKTLKNTSLPSLPSLPSVHLPQVRLPILWPKSHKFEYKAKFPLQQRREKFQAFQGVHPDMIAVIVERHMSSKLPQLPFFRFAVSPTLTYRHFCTMLHKRISSSVEQKNVLESIFFVIGAQIPTHETLLADIYNKYKDEDGMLYVTYQEQESFG